MHLNKYTLNEDKMNRRKSIIRQQAYNIINYAAKFVGVEEAIGTHTLRKTFGYHVYQRGVDLALLQKMFNHSSQSITLDYIGITQDQMDEVYISMNL
jgi:site-specific recombinase XerD